jgi:drug/metabolite transporter (DMT)-like permease
VALLAANLLLNLVASICFKEGGTDTAHRLEYFVGGNVLGISATALMMGLYKRLNANLAMMLVTGGSGIMVQVVFWLVYRTELTGLQMGGITMTVLGMVIATGGGAQDELPSAASGVAREVP